MPTFIRLTKSDGSWDSFTSDWTAQCATDYAALDDYNPAHLPMLERAAGDELKLGAFALKDDAGKFVAACQLNITPLPGYDGPVIRLRFLTLCPDCDNGTIGPERYPEILGDLLAGVIDLSKGEWPSQHIKFHLSSPSDYVFFGAMIAPLNASSEYDKVCVKGSWLYITKAGL